MRRRAHDRADLAGCFNVTIRFGYKETVDLVGTMTEIADRVAALERSVQDDKAGQRADSIKALSETSITHLCAAVVRCLG